MEIHQGATIFFHPLIIHSTKQWRDIPPNLDGDIRDHATLQQLIILSNMESLNAVIKQDVSRSERRIKSNRIAKEQMSCLLERDGTKRLEDSNNTPSSNRTSHARTPAPASHPG